MKKVLFIATVVKTHISVFHLPYIKMFKDKGYQTFVAAKNDYEDSMPDIPNCDKYVDISFARNPFHPKNIKAYKMLKKLIEDNDFDIIHCNTPVGGALGRLAARKARKKNGTKVIYMAHGFHFAIGGSKLAWLIFYPLEKLLSRITDLIVTINCEDYKIATARFNSDDTTYVHGIGVNLDRCEECNPDVQTVRESMHLKDGDILLCSAGELNDNKNHKAIINALAYLNNPKIHYAIMGDGKRRRKLILLTRKLGLDRQVHFLGYHNNVYEVMKSSDIFCFPSKREGLPVALMEAMASSLPVVASRVRGNRNLIREYCGGFLCDPDNPGEFAKYIRILVDNEKVRRKMGEFNRRRVQKYDLKIIRQKLEEIYFSDDMIR